jgi:uncharacterized MnhB-related membrane protein
MIFYLLVGIGIIICAVLSILSRRLLISAVWLALTSALVAVMIYMLGAPHIAVIELSVGAGLVTVLFVFAINIAGEDTTRLKSLVPKPIAISCIIVAFALGLLLVLKSTSGVQFYGTTAGESTILWENRYIDFLLQIVLIFSGVLGVIGLLAEKVKPDHEKEQE